MSPARLQEYKHALPFITNRGALRETTEEFIAEVERLRGFIQSSVRTEHFESCGKGSSPVCTCGVSAYNTSVVDCLNGYGKWQADSIAELSK